MQVASRSVAQVLHDAGVSFGLLYDGERNAGNDVRRIGEEGLFEMLVEQNMGVLAEAEFEAIFTTDPHSLNALRNEYPRFGLEKPVYHYSELLAELVAQGRISPHPAHGNAGHLLRPVLPGPLQPDHRGAAEADRGDRRRVGGDAAPRHEHVLLRRRRRPDLDDDEAEVSERPSEQRIREAQTLGDLDYFLVSCPKDRRCTRTRPRSSAPTSRSRS